MRHRIRQSRLYSISQFLRLSLSSPCPLCGFKAFGGDLCVECLHDVQAGVQSRPRCHICSDELSPDPIMLWSPLAPGYCNRCERHAPAFERSVIAMRYAFPTDGLMHDLKERGRLPLAAMMGRMLGHAIVEQAAQLPALLAIVPIPSSDTAIKRRGFNPAGEIARTVALELGLPCQRTWLRRNQSAGLQKHLSEQARQTALLHAYDAPPNLPPIWVGLVDDVLTTGSTMHQAALALRKRGVAGVIALAAMRTPRLVWHNTQHV